MFHDNDSKVVVILGYQLGEKELVFMINKTLFIRCYSIKCGLSLHSVDYYIMHYIFFWTNNSLSKGPLNKQINIIAHIKYD